MTTEKIIHADVLDIIFEKRNKAYGAYTLRKFYNKRLYKALAVTFLFASLLCGFTFIKHRGIEQPLLHVGGVVSLGKPPIERPTDILQPPKAASAAPKINTQKMATHIVIVNQADVPLVTTLQDDVPIGSEDLKGKPGLPIAEIPGNTTGDQPEAVIKPDVVVDKITPLNTAEQMPSYPGGMQALRKFLEKNLVNPEEMEDGKSVMVKIKFIVGYDGVLKGFETIEDGGTAFNNEVIRVLKKMPQWIPGKTKGENVSVYNMIPVKFTAAD